MTEFSLKVSRESVQAGDLNYSISRGLCLFRKTSNISYDFQQLSEVLGPVSRGNGHTILKGSANKGVMETQNLGWPWFPLGVRCIHVLAALQVQGCLGLGRLFHNWERSPSFPVWFVWFSPALLMSDARSLMPRPQADAWKCELRETKTQTSQDKAPELEAQLTEAGCFLPDQNTSCCEERNKTQSR